MLMHSFSSLHDSLLTRLSNDDDMEKNLSTFANEMTSSAMILGLYVQLMSVTHTEIPQALRLQKHWCSLTNWVEGRPLLKVSVSHMPLRKNSLD